MAADEERQELFFTVQHSGAVMVFNKKASARDNDVAVRMILGKSTQLADPHGIAFDADAEGDLRRQLGHVARVHPRPEGRPHRVHAGGGVRAAASSCRRPSPCIRRTRDQDVAPLRVIQGPKTGLDWPTNIAVDARRGELYVANSGGHSLLVFDVNAQGDEAPIRVLKGARTELQFPTGVFFDAANDEVWVANFGSHTATVYRHGTRRATRRRSASSAVRRATSRRPASATRTRLPTIRAARR